MSLPSVPDHRALVAKQLCAPSKCAFSCALFAGRERGRTVDRTRVGARTGPLETGLLETGSLETGSLETGSLETGSLETGSLEIGSLETGSGPEPEPGGGGGGRGVTRHAA